MKTNTWNRLVHGGKMMLEGWIKNPERRMRDERIGIEAWRDEGMKSEGGRQDLVDAGVGWCTGFSWLQGRRGIQESRASEWGRWLFCLHRCLIVTLTGSCIQTDERERKKRRFGEGENWVKRRGNEAWMLKHFCGQNECVLSQGFGSKT